MKILTNEKKIGLLYLTAIYSAVLFFNVQCTESTSKQDKIQAKVINKQKDSLPPPKVFKEKIQIINQTFLGNFQRDYYGDSLPDNLKINWKLFLGKGKTRVGKDTFEWAGAGWTGQPLLFKEDSTLYLVQGAYDHNLKKINADRGQLIWQYPFDDVIKGTGTLWIDKSQKDSLYKRYIILQGARKGLGNSLWKKVIPSFRAISLLNAKEFWRMNVWHTHSYSRDVDASALFYQDTFYIGLENGCFVKFLAGSSYTFKRQGIIQPLILDTFKLYSKKDVKTHHGNLVTEASPALLGNHIYIASGSGHIYGYNIKSQKLDWQFDVGSDIDGTPVVTNDSCLLISIEKQYIKGKGGMLKLNPGNPPQEAVVWFFPVPNRDFSSWEGGIIGSASISDYYTRDTSNNIACFNTIKGTFYVVKHEKIDSSKKVFDFNLENKYHRPQKIFSYSVGPSISTPIIIPPRILVATYTGIYLFEYDKNYKIKLIAKRSGGFESTPFSYHGKVYIASRDGNLYQFGKK